MSTERHERVKSLFHEALDRPAGERDAFLREQCEGDDALLAEIRDMLAFEESSPDFLESTAVARELSASVPIPDRLGPFRVLQLLGEGGMGAVYEAEQERPRRRVALKVLHPGLATPHMLRRFELESEVLGRLEHPGIARIYEAGSSDTGRGPQPWFAMELVHGEPLTDYCVRHALPLETRLELMAEVCDAVHHAHQRGIVHRDLKPANVLVGEQHRPKVLDFGIARPTDDDLPRATLRTDPGMIVGTLQYMSPEQAGADPDAIDVRTDVYSLGVMLYELVARRPPLVLSRLPMHEALRRVLEDEPEPLRKVAPRVPVDVAVVVHKALEKDKERRYSSAAELAADLRRFLRREPIAAQPPSNWYRFCRFAARNKALVGGAAATLAALVVGLAVALWQRNEAREALARVEGINRFLFSDVLASPTPEHLGRDVRVVDVLAPAARSAERAFANDPRVAAEVLDAVGSSYRALGLPAESERLTRRALALLGEGADDRLALRVRGHLADSLTDLDRSDEAVAMLEPVVAAGTRQFGRDDADTLTFRASLAEAQWAAGQPERGVAELRAVAAARARVFGPEDARTLATRSELAVHLAELGEIAEARAMLTETLAIQERVLGPEHPGSLGSRNLLAWMLTLGGAYQDAEKLYAGLLPALVDVYGPDHPYTAEARIDMASCPLHLGRAAEAEASVRQACQDLEKRLGPEHTLTLKAHLMLAEVYLRTGKPEAAIAEAQHVVDVTRSAHGDASEELGHALMKLGRCYQEAQQDSAAAKAFGEAVIVYEKAFSEPTDYLAQAWFNLGVATRDSGNPVAAIDPLRRAVALDVEHWGAGHRHVAADRYNLAVTLLAAGRADEAVTEIRAALELALAVKFSAERIAGYRSVLGQALLASGRGAEAEPVLREAVEAYAAAGHPDDDGARRARAALVALYQQQGRAADAARYRDR